MKLVVVESAAFGFDFWRGNRKAEFWNNLSILPVRTVFPALTCPVQASFRTALPPESHGMVANGFFDRKLCRTFFWEQSSELYSGERIWSRFRGKGGTVGQICWQQSIGTDSDMILSPAPIHKHHGGMIQDFYSEPRGLYRSLRGRIGAEFNLRSYWGPFTSSASSEWIADAASNLLVSREAPNILLVYLPHCDYALQKHGPCSGAAVSAFHTTELLLERIFASAKLAGYEILIFGDYAITSAEQAVFPNRVLREKGFFRDREIKGMLYPDLHTSRAFAMADHQLAHVYIREEGDIAKVEACFKNISGVKKIWLKKELNHERSGELILEAAAGFWFAYPWWDKPSEAPDYAVHVDIHSKPGFDPCELFMSLWPPFSISADVSKIRGTHGSADSTEHLVLSAASFSLDKNSDSLIGVSRQIMPNFIR